MKKLKPLNAIQRRDLLASEKFTREQALAYAEDYLARGQYDNAVEFFAKAGSKEGMERVKQVAIEQGAAALLHHVARTRLVEVLPAEWEQAGDNAMRQGKYAYALFAYQKSNNDLKIAKAQEYYTPPPSAFERGRKE